MNPKDAFHHTIHSSPGGCQAAAVRMGYSYTVLKNKANPNVESNHATLDDVDTAMELFEDYSVLHALANKHGFVCTKVKDEPASADVHGVVIDIWAKLGNLGAEVSAGMADGRIDRKEAAAIEAAMYEALRPILGLGATINAMVTKC